MNNNNTTTINGLSNNYFFDSLPITVSRENHGSNIIVGLSGKCKRDIVRYFNGVYNMNGCPSSASLHWITTKKGSYLAKFQTTEERFLKSLIDLNIFMAAKEGKSANKRLATKCAHQHYKMMERDEYLNDNKIHHVMSGW